MKYKTLARTAGVIGVAAGSFTIALFSNHVLAEGPLPLRGFGGLGYAAGLYFITDGTIDLIAGTHHYFGLKLYKQYFRMRGDRENMDGVDTEIRKMLDRREKELTLPPDLELFLFSRPTVYFHAFFRNLLP